MVSQELALLARWREHRDSEAFRELARLHGGMVYATCRRITGSATDAEDLTQECLETLAVSLAMPRESVGAWLHGMATHKALNRNRSERRRVDREKRFAELRETDADGMPSEVSHLVHEALAELPESLSGPVVAHYFEQRSHGEIAESLGVSRQTVTYRIGKSLGLLERSLAKRGVTLGVAALVTALEGQRAEAIPVTLTARLEAIAHSMPPGGPPVSPTNTLNARPRYWIHVAAWTGLLVLAGGMTWYFVGAERPERISGDSNRGQEPATARTDPDRASDAASSDDVDSQNRTAEAVTAPLYSMVSGYVGDEAGYALAGATVTVTPLEAFYGPYSKVHSTATDELGRYLIANADLDGAAMVVVNAAAHQFGSQEVGLLRGEAVTDVDFILAEGIELNGRLALASGEPVRDANIVLAGYAGENGGYGVGGFRNLVRTDADGVFQMGAAEQGIAALRVAAADGHEGFFDRVAVDGGPIELVMQDPATVRGVVTRADGSPAAHVGVQVCGEYTLPIPDQEAEARGVFVWRTALTDAEGRYNTGALAPGQFYVAKVVAADESRPLSADLELGVLESGPFDRDISLREGETIRGTVRGSVTGTVIEQIQVRYTRDDGRTDPETAWRIDLTAGTYSLTVFEPGRYRIWAEYPHGLPEYMGDAFTVDVPIGEGPAPVAIDLEMPDPVSYSVHAIDDAGEPIPGAEVELWAQLPAESPRRVTPSEPQVTDANGFFTWGWFPPDTEAWFQVGKAGYVSSQSQRIVGVPGVAYDGGPITLYPSAGVEGRLVDEQGKPLANSVLVMRMTFDGFEIRNRGFSAEGLTIATRTDSNGEFAVAEGLPGTLPGSLTLTAHPPGGEHHMGVVERFEAIPGRVADIGDRVCVSQTPIAGSANPPSIIP